MIHVKRFLVGLMLILGGFVLLAAVCVGVTIAWDFIVSVSSDTVRQVANIAFATLIFGFIGFSVCVMAYMFGEEILENRKRK